MLKTAMLIGSALGAAQPEHYYSHTKTFKKCFDLINAGDD